MKDRSLYIFYAIARYSATITALITTNFTMYSD